MLNKIAQIDGDEAEQRLWLAFFIELSSVTSHADVVSLLRNQPLPGEPGREYFDNLGLFIECFEISPTAKPAELAQYLRIIRLIASNLELPILALQLIQEGLMKAINERRSPYSSFHAFYSLELNRVESEITALNESLENRVEERTKALEAVNQELGEFCRSVSHDLRGPLRTIIATSGILIADHAGQLDEEGLEMLRRQQAAGNRLAKLIDDLLRLSRLTHQEMVWVDVDLSGLVAEVADELSARVWNNAPQFTVQPGVQASGDRTLLRAVLQNLMENACKFSPGGAKVTFGLREELSGRIVFFVSDEGVGFDMRYVGKVFKPFERLVSDTEFEGTGIGLANVERIIRRHGGELWAESSLGRGTTIFFTLGV